jgi:hypothetical protein
MTENTPKRGRRVALLATLAICLVGVGSTSAFASTSKYGSRDWTSNSIGNLV